MDHVINNNLLSAVMIVYNGSSFIGESIQSVLDQTYSDFEFLILNDGSTDDTEKIIQSFASKDKRIRYLKNTVNKGLSYSRNKIINEANGLYIAVTDADDISKPERFEKQMAYLNSNPNIAILGSSVTLINDSGKIFDTWQYPTKHNDIATGLQRSCIIANPSCVFKKDVFKKINGYSEFLTICEDWDFFQRACKLFTCANLNESLILYRIHNNNISKNKLEHTIVFSAYLNNKIDNNDFGLNLAQTAEKYPQLHSYISELCIQFYLFWINTYLKLGYEKLSEDLFDHVVNNYFTFFTTQNKRTFILNSFKIFIKQNNYKKSLSLLPSIFK